jgi:rhodanese-related sulfurtransferase
MAETFTMQDLHERAGSLGANALMLDVRSPEEFAEGHIAGARNIPHETVASHANELKKREKVYVYCRTGRRAVAACEALKKAGLANLVCIGTTGMKHWLEAGYPVEK